MVAAFLFAVGQENTKGKIQKYDCTCKREVLIIMTANSSGVVIRQLQESGMKPIYIGAREK